MAQKVTIGTQCFFLDFVVISLEKKAYDVLVGRNWLIAGKVNHILKQNTLSIESKWVKYVINLRNQAMRKEWKFSNSQSRDGKWSTKRKRMKPSEEGVLQSEEYLDDETSCLNGLFQYQIEDDEVSHCKYNMLHILEVNELVEAQRMPLSPGIQGI